MRKFQCCFCGEGIEKSRWEPLTLTVNEPKRDSPQFLWSHVNCLGQNLNKVPFFSLSDRIEIYNDWVQEQVASLEVGQLLEGSITMIKEYGVAIDISNGFHGLLHISNISQQPVVDPNTIFNVGDFVKAIIVDIDKPKGRVSLSTSVLEVNPGDMIIDSKKVFEDAETMANIARGRIDSV